MTCSIPYASRSRMPSRVARAIEAAMAAAAGEAPDEDPGVQEVRLHPDAIAEHGAPAERARRVDRDDAHALAARTEPRRDPVREGRLPRSGRARDAHDVSTAGAGMEPAHERRHSRSAVLDQGHQPCEG